MHKWTTLIITHYITYLSFHLRNHRILQHINYSFLYLKVLVNRNFPCMFQCFLTNILLRSEGFTGTIINFLKVEDLLQGPCMMKTNWTLFCITVNTILINFKVCGSFLIFTVLVKELNLFQFDYLISTRRNSIF